MIKNKLIIFIFLYTISSILYAQENFFEKQEIKLIELAEIILNGQNDSIKEEANLIFLETLENTLNTKKSYIYNFGEIKHMSIVQPKDEKFKLFTWFIPLNSGNYKYFGLIQKCKKNGKKCEIYYLSSFPKDKVSFLNKKIEYDEWYGCLYYDIVTIKINKKIYYTLLGWDGNNNITTKKFIEVLNLEKKKTPYFGANIFNNKQKRILIEYSSKYPVSLNYDIELECIVFDHIEPIDGVSINNFNLYAPDLSYDIFRKTKNGWKLETNIYLNNNK